LNSPITGLSAIDELFSHGYKAIFVAVGLGKPVSLGLPGEHLRGVYTWRELLSRLNVPYVGTRKEDNMHLGSGGVEKNIDIALCRRFKSRGMSWSRAGAQNLLKLRLLRYDRNDWRAYWRRRAN